MAQLAIKGHATRGKEIIEIFELLGGKNYYKLNGNHDSSVYYIRNDSSYNNVIDYWEGNYPIDFMIFTLEQFLEKFPYKVGDRVRIAEYEAEVRIDDMKWDGNKVQYEVFTDMTEWYSAEELNLFNEPYKEETMEEIKIDIQVHYPKTYEECCEIIGIEYPVVGGKPDGLSASTYRITEIRPFIYLLICRDAYWKIAGEQMGLDKPWSPSKNDNVYCIFRFKGEIVKDNFVFGDSLILEFPTEEMRGAFYENFKDLIEKCKKLL